MKQRGTQNFAGLLPGGAGGSELTLIQGPKGAPRVPIREVVLRVRE